MSVSVRAADLKNTRDLFVLYNKKGLFDLSEYVDVSTVFKNIDTALNNLDDATATLLDKKDVAYVLSAINVCSQRPTDQGGVGVQNYKLISALFETLSEAYKASDDSEEETKSD